MTGFDCGCEELTVRLFSPLLRSPRFTKSLTGLHTVLRRGPKFSSSLLTASDLPNGIRCVGLLVSLFTMPLGVWR